jgi:hypothetical protein
MYCACTAQVTSDLTDKQVSTARSLYTTSKLDLVESKKRMSRISACHIWLIWDGHGRSYGMTDLERVIVCHDWRLPWSHWTIARVAEYTAMLELRSRSVYRSILSLS